MDLSILVPAFNERDNIVRLVPELRKTIPADVREYEIIVVDNHSPDGTATAAADLGTVVVQQTEPGYGGALRAGFERARGRYVLTLDADLSHPPHLVTTMWEARRLGEVVAASRYVPGGASRDRLWRRSLSYLLNVVFSRGLSLPVRDVSSGYRLYSASVLRNLSLQSTQFDVLQEVLIHVYARGYRIIEVPFCSRPRQRGESHVRLLKFGWAYLRTFLRMWRLRNSIDSADYDDRAFDSVVPLQRYWQRKRHQIVTQFAHGAGRTLDIGCGSSRILPSLDDAIGLDTQLSKMRYMRRRGAQVSVGSAFALPFPSATFDCLVCSQVIEHVPATPSLFEELRRVLRPGGRLVIGTPDYGTPAWPVIEFFYARLAPGGYADEHVTRYTRRSLEQTLNEHGFVVNLTRYVAGAELILQSTRAV